MLDCPDLAVPPEVMQHVVNVESARNPFAIGVVGGYLAKQPASLDEALAAVRQLKGEGYNFSVGIAQVNRYNLAKYGLPDYASAFQACPNLRAGSRILRECYDRAQDWGKAFSCYYSGNFVTGFDHGYVQKVFASIRKAQYAVQDTPKAVRVIAYNSKVQRKIARDDNLPLTGAGQAATPVVASAYPEPYAIRRHLPNTQRSGADPAASGVSAMPTAENRPATPVPGPGAVMVNGGFAPASGLSGIPVQIVGVGGDPYKTAIINPAVQPVAAGDLPMPNPDAPLPIDDSKASRAGKTSPSLMDARKGGALLQVHEATAPATPQGLKTQAMVGSAPDSAAPQSSDKSFVF